ncbi:class I adenylate-forming enzyme family protein [Mycobacterium sp.]|uniref:class I adenylate-forming enzyme family protein n=1 Tax=Mycobacterium sp. TaxID=1785 RepID=UPI000CC76262|nr:class I adenylate-forming enzyme family protein [Mycobacterium sp.]PJE05993.1 MAG: acyl--CoA ligase [Mycobacterium sp.]
MSALPSVVDRREALRRRSPHWRPQSLACWVDNCAAENGSRPMVLTEDRALSYHDVAEQSRQLADGLVALGVEPGDRVGIVMANYPEFAAIKFAIARAGAIAVPMNYLYRAEELRFVVADSGCRVVITMTEFAGLRYPDMLRGMPGEPTVVLLDTDGRAPPGALTVPDLAALGHRHGGASSEIVVDPLSASDMLYTSGTTGSPKGVLVSHDAVLRTAYASALTRAYEDGRRILFSLPCYHMFGYIEGLLSAMFVGGAIIPLTKFSAKSYFAGIEHHRATDMLCVPTMAVAMLEDPARIEYDLSSLTAILCGSAPAPVWLWEAIEADFGVSEIVTGYGMTECGGAMTLTLPEDPLTLTSETAGRPKMAGCAGVDGTDDLVVYKAVDPETGADVPAGAEGELVSRGPTVMLGYWNRPAETAAALRNGWLHSGDLGRVPADGYLRVTGRSKELYKSGGELVMPKEIEDLLEARDDISQAFAIGLLDERWGEIGCAVVVRVPGSHITEDDVLHYCRENLARFKVPKRVVFCRAEELPTTTTGKVQKFRLVQQLGSTPWDADSKS